MGLVGILLLVCVKGIHLIQDWDQRLDFVDLVLYLRVAQNMKNFVT